MMAGGLTIGRMRGFVDKLTWGTRVVGLAYQYPQQFPTVLVLFGDFIDPEFPFLTAIARPGWTIVDVGAAIGQFSLFAATLPGARVYALEPSRLNLVTLRRNILRNAAAGRVTTHRLALSSEEGEAHFETSSDAFMSGLGSATGDLVRVTTMPRLLDQFGLGQVSVLKLNVAGHEPAVLEGAMPCFASGRVDVLVTLLGLASLRWYEAIARLGYRFFYYHPRRKSLHEVLAFDEHTVLDHRPWPARHIIAVSPGAIASGLLAGLPIQPLPFSGCNAGAEVGAGLSAIAGG